MVNNTGIGIQESGASSQNDRCRVRGSSLNPNFLTLIPILFSLLTAYCLLPTGFAQQPQTQAVQELFPVNAKYVQGFGPGYWPTAGSNLTLNLAAGTAVCSSIVRTYAGGTLALAPSATNYVYLNTSNNCAPASNTIGFSSTTIPIATVVTNGTAITSITDVRSIFVSNGASGSGSVTSVGMTGDGIIFSPTVSGSPITSTGTLTPQLLTQTASTVLAGPGTGQAATPTFRALMPGDLPTTIFSNTTGNAATATALASSPIQCGSNNWATGITTGGNANCLQPGFGNLSGTAAVSQGGTGQTTAASAFNALSPLTTEGDILYYHSSANARLAKGTNGQCLTSNGTDPVWGSCSTGTGTVTSVGLAMPSIFSVSGSPVTGSGTLSAALANQNANLFMAGPASGNAAAPTFRALVGADLPNPSASTLGGIESKTCTSGQFLNQISTAGAPICATPAGGSATGLGNGTTVIDASLQAGADFGSKLIAAIATCPSDGCVIDARGLGGPQTLGENVLFSSAYQPIAIWLASSLILTRASGMQFQVGTNGRLIGQGKTATTITGNDATAAVIGVYGGGAPANVDIENLGISNAGIGACVDFLTTSGGSLSATIHDNSFSCATGVLTSGYWNRIWNNTFNASTASTPVLWAGTVLDDTGYGGYANSNHIYDNLYFGNGWGTGDFLRSTGGGSYNNIYDGAEDYEGTSLSVFASSLSSEFHLSGDNENVMCNNRVGWAASTAYGRGAILWDGTNCEIDVTPTTLGYSTTSGSGSHPMWPTVQGNKVTDGGVIWEMYTGNQVANSAYFVFDVGAQENTLTGIIGLNAGVTDLDYLVNGRTSNYINTQGNGRGGTQGTAPYQLNVFQNGVNFLGKYGNQPGIGPTLATLNLNYFNGDAGPGSLLNGASLDIPVAGNECSTYGYCGHLNLRLGSLYSFSGSTFAGPTSFNQLPTPAAPTVTVVGTPGTATATYYLVAHVNGGVTLPSAATTIANAPNTLNSTNYVVVKIPTYIWANYPATWVQDPWSNATWDVLKGNTSTSLYANVSFTPNGVADQGGSTSAYTPPTRNTTADETHYGYPYFAGNVGIGTSSPAYPLHVVGSNSVMVEVDGSNQYISFTVNNTTGKQASVNLAQNGSQAWAFGTDFAGAGTADFFLYQSAGLRNPLYIDTAGNVRLGGTSGYAGTQAMTILQGGNVGIGISSPGQKLDVAGGYIRSDTGFCISSSCLTSLWSNPMTTPGDLIYGGAGGVGARLPGNTSTTPMFLKSIGVSGSATAPTLAQIQFSDIAGTLGISAGGTGHTTAASSFNALAPLTAEGDLIYYTSSSNARLPLGSSGTYLRSNGTDPAYATIQPADLPAVTFYQTQSSATSNAATAAVTTNNIKLYAFYVPFPVKTSNFGYYIQTADNTSNSYDVGAYGPGCLNSTSNVPLAFHIGTTAGTTLAPSTGAKTLALAGGPITIAPGWYCFAYTSSAATPALVFGGQSSQIFALPFATASVGGGGAALPSTITAPALAWGPNAQLWMYLY
jgi:hypothetical protein